MELLKDIALTSYQIFKIKKINDFIVNIGGEIFCSGNKKGEDWVVAIEKPFMNIQKPMYILNLSNKALATSGSYRKIKKIDNKIVSHTMSPKTFLPVENELISVSIMADNCMDADAYATACMSMGLVKSKKFIENHKIDACIIYKMNDDTLTFITKFIKVCVFKVPKLFGFTTFVWRCSTIRTIFSILI